MDKQEGLSTNKASRFDGSNYAFLKIQLEFYLQSLGMDVWKSVEDGYEFLKATDELEENDECATSKTVSVDTENRRQYEWNVRAKNVILFG